MLVKRGDLAFLASKIHLIHRLAITKDYRHLEDMLRESKLKIAVTMDSLKFYEVEFTQETSGKKFKK